MPVLRTTLAAGTRKTCFASAAMIFFSLEASMTFDPRLSNCMVTLQGQAQGGRVWKGDVHLAKEAAPGMHLACAKALAVGATGREWRCFAQQIQAGPGDHQLGI